jgi:hypothetical protein
MVSTYLTSLAERHARVGRLFGYGREDTLTWSITALPANCTMAIPEPHDGTLLPGWAHRSDTDAVALALQVEWACGRAHALPSPAWRH